MLLDRNVCQPPISIDEPKPFIWIIGIHVRNGIGRRVNPSIHKVTIVQFTILKSCKYKWSRI